MKRADRQISSRCLIRTQTRIRQPSWSINLVDAYIEKRLQVLNSEKPKQFLEKKVNEYRQGLRESEDKLEAFRQQHQVFALDEQKQLLIQQRSNLDNAIKAAQTQNKELQQKQSSLEIQTRQVPQNLPAAPVVQTPNDAERPSCLPYREKSGSC